MMRQGLRTFSGRALKASQVFCKADPRAGSAAGLSCTAASLTPCRGANASLGHGPIISTGASAALRVGQARYFSAAAKKGEEGGKTGKVWWEDGISFKCVKCGKCCKRSEPVLVNAKEIAAISELKKVPQADLKKGFIDEDWGSAHILPFCLKRTSGGACIFLDEKGACSIYEARPTQCRTYPFWPENMGSREAYLAEEQHCDAVTPTSTPPHTGGLDVVPRVDVSAHTIATVIHAQGENFTHEESFELLREVARSDPEQMAECEADVVSSK
ncbi:hypothetical protein T484DRAFT_1948245 [Baffinella frigidus]|nr:hypothetical protein T484DRAFT_1948245 [Cryptophyta sp. CCMP2293]